MTKSNKNISNQLETQDTETLSAEEVIEMAQGASRMEKEIADHFGGDFKEELSKALFAYRLVLLAPFIDVAEYMRDNSNKLMTMLEDNSDEAFEDDSDYEFMVDTLYNTEHKLWETLSLYLDDDKIDALGVVLDETAN